MENNLNIEKHPDALIVINPEGRKIHIGFLVCDFPLFCTPIGDGFYNIETDLIFNDGKIRRLYFPSVFINISSGQTALERRGETLWELGEELEKGRTQEEYFNARKELKNKDSL